MCSYCGCEAEAVISQLMEDHAEIASMVRDVRSAAASGQAGVAKDICAKISSLFAVHSQLEEEGLFAELMSDPLATDAISELTTEHRSLQSGLAALASGARTLLFRRSMPSLSTLTGRTPMCSPSPCRSCPTRPGSG